MLAICCCVLFGYALLDFNGEKRMNDFINNLKVAPGMNTVEPISWAKGYNDRLIRHKRATNIYKPQDITESTLWGSGVVDDSTVSDSISLAKKKLDDSTELSRQRVARMKARHAHNKRTEEEERNEGYDELIQNMFDQFASERERLEGRVGSSPSGVSSTMNNDIKSIIDSPEYKAVQESKNVDSSITVPTMDYKVVESASFGEYKNKRAMRYFADFKKEFPWLNQKQLSAIIGNLHHESAGFTAFKEGGVKIGGEGDAQWTDNKKNEGRRTDFRAFCKKHKLDPKSYEASLSFMVHELKTNRTHGFTEKFKKSKFFDEDASIADLVIAFEHQFFRAKKGHEHYEDRIKDATFYDDIMTQDPLIRTSAIPPRRPSSFVARRGDE